ncbi:MAG: VOC family protein [Pseudomonadota bacterium]
MQLGHFSISLAVKDIERSRDFYTKLGFELVGGNAEQHWLILQNGDSTIGLFQGMFESNILTFNPGRDSRSNVIAGFTDIRDIQRHLKTQGIELTSETDETAMGPASFTLTDPDGNAILVDQHVE